VKEGNWSLEVAELIAVKNRKWRLGSAQLISIRRSEGQEVQIIYYWVNSDSKKLHKMTMTHRSE